MAFSFQLGNRLVHLHCVSLYPILRWLQSAAVFTLHLQVFLSSSESSWKIRVKEGKNIYLCKLSYNVHFHELFEDPSYFHLSQTCLSPFQNWKNWWMDQSGVLVRYQREFQMILWTWYIGWTEWSTTFNYKLFIYRNSFHVDYQASVNWWNRFESVNQSSWSIFLKNGPIASPDLICMENFQNIHRLSYMWNLSNF